MTPGKILVSGQEGSYLIKMIGDVRVVLCASLNQYIETIFEDNRPVQHVLVDLLEAEGVDSTTLGLLVKLGLHCRNRLKLEPQLFCIDESILRTLQVMGLDELFVIITRSPDQSVEWKELETVKADELETSRNVLEAHKLLVALKPENKEEFIDLIRLLEDASSKGEGTS